MERFNVLLFRPRLFLHHEAYAGAARQLCNALRRLGYPARVAANEIVWDATNILVGVHNLEPQLIERLPTNSIVYNVEKMFADSKFLAELSAFIRRFETWDYSAANVAAWREAGISDRVRLPRPGYLPEDTTMPRLRRIASSASYGRCMPRSIHSRLCCGSSGRGSRNLTRTCGRSRNAVRVSISSGSGQPTRTQRPSKSTPRNGIRQVGSWATARNYSAPSYPRSARIAAAAAIGEAYAVVLAEAISTLHFAQERSRIAEQMVCWKYR